MNSPLTPNTATATPKRPKTKPPAKPVKVAAITPKVAEVDPALTAIVEQQERLTKAADQLFFKLADDVELSAAEWGLLRAAGPHATGSPAFQRGEFQRWVERQTGRLKGVRKLQRKAGSESEREAARQAATEATEKFATEAPKIEAKIAELQNQLAELAQDDRKKQAVADGQRAAVAGLQADNTLPQFVTDEINQAIRSNASRFKGELVKLQSRVDTIPNIVAFDPVEDRKQILQYVEGNPSLGGTTLDRLQRFFECHTDGNTTTPRKVRTDAWARHCAELRQEAEELAPKISELEPMKAAAQSEIDALRSFYVPE